VRGKARIDERIALLRDALPLTTDAGVLLPALLATGTLVAELRVVLAGIERYEQAIDRAFKAHPDAAIFASLPGAGPTLAPRLLAALGSDRKRWPDALGLQQYLGVAPVTERSGNKRWVHWRWACPKFLRQSVVEWAGMSVRFSVWAAGLLPAAARARARATTPRFGALAFKWLRILHRCWKDHKPYDEAVYLKALQKSESPLMAVIAGQAASAK
jgi:transposase